MRGRTSASSSTTTPTDSPRLVAAAEYLSGNVRVKLEHARAAAANDTSFEVNVTALERVLPADIGAEEIAPRLGAAWITTEDHQAFLAEILDDRSVQVEHPGANVWAVRARRDTLLASSEWGTSRMSAGEITKAVLEQRPIRVTDERSATACGRQRRRDRRRPGKSQRAAERFSEWVWQEPDRAGASHTSNTTTVSTAIVPRLRRRASAVPPRARAQLSTPRPHQLAAVARIIAEPTVGLFHQVGAGKTAEMVMGAMELNASASPISPGGGPQSHARAVLARVDPDVSAGAAPGREHHDLDREGRRLFRQVRGRDWDGIVMTRSAFERIPVSPSQRPAI